MTVINKTFGKVAGGAVLGAALLAPSVLSSVMHDQDIQTGFRSEVYKDKSQRLLTVRTDGVTRQGMLTHGAALEDFPLGFYNRPSSALLIAGKPEAACWYVNLQVTDGRDNLPFWQKIFGGAEYERQFSNESFNKLSYTCAPLPENSLVP